MSQPNAPETKLEVMRRGASMLAERVPSGWSTSFQPDAGHRVDGLIEILGPGGQIAVLAIEANRLVNRRDVESIRERLDTAVGGIPRGHGMVMARYLSPPVRMGLTDAGIAYLDATGNMRVDLQDPGLFLSDRGADSDPWRGPGRPRGTLKGAPAAKIVRAVADFVGPWTMRELAEVAKTSTGATYRVVDYLEDEGLAKRDAKGIVTVPDWSEVLRTWSSDYQFVRDNRITQWIELRGLQQLLDRVGSVEQQVQYAVSGSQAAAEWAAYAPSRAAMIYVADAAQAAGAWELRPADAGTNVMLAEPATDVVFERSWTNQGGVEIAAPTQVVVDLMTGPGRNPSEAEELLEWMKQNEPTWRIKR
ncbi:MAG: hypothetical protein R2754_00235 [Microthrixaceae bacterium]